MTKRKLICAGALLAPVLALLRVLEKKLLIDPATGFYTEASPLRWAFVLLCALTLILTAAGASACRVKELTLKDTRWSGLSCFLLALAAGWETLRLVEEWTGSLNRTQVWSLTPVFTAFLAVFTALSCPILLILSFHLLQGRMRGYRSSAAMAILVLWQCMRLVRKFAEYPTAFHISDQLLELLLTTCSVVFMLSSARAYSDVRLNRAVPAAVFSGVLSGVCGLALVLPQAVAALLWEGFAFSFKGQALNIACALYGLATAADLLRSLDGGGPAGTAKNR
ncbi:MAG: hypothetical protein PHE09_13130 [Oscillospiraceae bacterium]|nr:hypothetical protein [Oscillospiraceae bacterium]